MQKYISRRVAEMPPSGIRRFFDLINTMDDVISLSIGEPDFTTPMHIREAGIRSLLEGRTAYSSNAGMFELRKHLAEHLEWLYGVRYNAETELLITVGASEALACASIALLDPGDEVLIPQPSYVSFPADVAFAGGVPVIVPTFYEDEFQVTVEQLHRAITPRTKAILLSYPNNPTGAVLDRERAQAIVDLARKHDLLIFSDEIYHRLVYGVEHVCFSALDGAWERTVLIGGFSKSYAMTGWRIGYVAAPGELLQAIAKVHQYIIMCAPTQAQYAALEALLRGEEDVEQMRAEYDRRRRVIVAGLNQIGLPTFEPKGAFYCFPRIEHLGMSDEEFAEELLKEEKVAVVPGSAFGACGAGHVRVCYATGMDQIEEALDRIDRFVRRRGG